MNNSVIILTNIPWIARLFSWFKICLSFDNRLLCLQIWINSDFFSKLHNMHKFSKGFLCCHPSGMILKYIHHMHIPIIRSVQALHKWTYWKCLGGVAPSWVLNQPVTSNRVRRVRVQPRQFKYTNEQCKLASKTYYSSGIWTRYLSVVSPLN